MTTPTRSDEVLAEVKEAVRDTHVRFELIRTFGAGTAVRIEHRDVISKRWTVVKTLIFPPEGQSIADVLAMLIELRAGAEPETG